MAGTRVHRAHREGWGAGRMTRAFGASLAVGVAALAASARLPAAGATDTARAAHVLAGTATADLHLLKIEGSVLIEEGPVNGSLDGTAKAYLNIGSTGSTLAARFTITTRSGTISAQGTAHPHGSGRYTSFAGTYTIVHGTGRYAHIHGRAGLYGVFDRNTEAVILQATGGTLSY